MAQLTESLRQEDEQVAVPYDLAVQSYGSNKPTIMQPRGRPETIAELPLHQHLRIGYPAARIPEEFDVAEWYLKWIVEGM